MVVVPAATPVTTPTEFTVATDNVPELQVPPVTVFVSAVVAPAHTVAMPVMVPAEEPFTVTIADACAVPHPFVII